MESQNTWFHTWIFQFFSVDNSIILLACSPNLQYRSSIRVSSWRPEKSCSRSQNIIFNVYELKTRAISYHDSWNVRLNFTSIGFAHAILNHCSFKPSSRLLEWHPFKSLDRPARLNETLTPVLFEAWLKREIKTNVAGCHFNDEVNVQVSWHIWIMFVQDLLARSGVISWGRRYIERQVRRRQPGAF